MSVNAQVVFQENFDAIAEGAMPTNWTVFNVDGLTPNTEVAFVTNAWVCSLPATDYTTIAAWSTSWYTPAGASDDWMFTPGITVPATNPVLQYMEYSPDASYSDGYELRIMTAAPTTGNITTSTVLLTVAAGSNTPLKKTIDLSSYVGQTVYIGWRNTSDDMFLLGIDDVVVKSLQNNDASLFSINTPSIVGAGNSNITGTIKNLGFNAITSYDVTYKIDGGTASAIYSVTGANVLIDGTANFTHNVPAALTTGSHSVEVTISNVNGATDPNTADNVLTKQLAVASQTVPKMPLYEGFSASTCAPCASFNGPTFNPWAASHLTDMNYIKYQVNWPGAGDPYYIAAAGTRVTYYGVTGVPDLFANGTSCPLSSNGLNAALAKSQSENAVFEILATPTYTGNNVSIPLTINSYITKAGLTVHAVVCEKLTTQNTGTNGETSFHHVMMKMLPTASGTTVSFTDGAAYTNTLTADMTRSSTCFVEQMSDLIVVVFIQDNTTKEVLQSKTFDIVTTGIDNLSKNNVTLYPNPSTGIVNITNTTNAQINVMNMVGQIVLTDNGSSVDMSNLTNGTYFVQIIEGEYITTKKIILNK